MEECAFLHVEVVVDLQQERGHLQCSPQGCLHDRSKLNHTRYAHVSTSLFANADKLVSFGVIAPKFGNCINRVYAAVEGQPSGYCFQSISEGFDCQLLPSWKLQSEGSYLQGEGHESGPSSRNYFRSRQRVFED